MGVELHAMRGQIIDIRRLIEVRARITEIIVTDIVKRNNYDIRFLGDFNLFPGIGWTILPTSNQSGTPDCYQPGNIPS